MKKRYHFSVKNCLWLWLVTSLAVFFSFELQAQNIPTKQWEKTFGSKDVEQFKTIKQSSDGGYILGGYGFDREQAKITGFGAWDFWIIKLDPNGNKVWDKFLGGKGVEIFSDLIETPNGNILIGGYSVSDVSGEKSQPPLGGPDIWVINLDKDGNKVWDKIFGGEKQDGLSTIVHTDDNFYFLGGSSQGFQILGEAINRGGFLLIKLDLNGSKIWEKIYGRSISNGLVALIEKLDKGFILGGNTHARGYNESVHKYHKGWKDVWIVNVNSEGKKLWDVQIGGKDLEELISLQITHDGGCFVVGNTLEINETKKVKVRRELGFEMMKEHKWGPKNYWILKLDKGGKQQWKKVFRKSDSKLAGFQQTPDGGFLLIENFGPEIIPRFKRLPHESKVVKLNSKGKKIWEITVTQNEGKVPTDLQLTSDGGFVLGGNFYVNEKDEFPDYWVVKYGPEGR